MNTAFRDEVKETLDAACPKHSFRYKDECRRECLETPSIAWPFCWVCHHNAALADRIAEIKVGK